MQGSAQTQREVRKARKALGLCTQCPNPATRGRRCEHHYQKDREAAARYYTKHRQSRPEGKCWCGDAVKPNRKACVRHCAQAAAKTKRQSDQWRAEGRCQLCGGVLVPDRTMCMKHLTQLRDRARVRNKERQDAGLCQGCGKVSELGQRRCLACRVVKHDNSLPNPVRRALKELRQNEKLEADNARCRARREFIDRHLHLFPKPRTREILRMRYGYTENTCQTLEQIGQRLGVTRERIRQIQEQSEETILMFTIEKNIPLPAGGLKGKAAELRDTLIAMDIGDSFLIPSVSKNSILSSTAKALGVVVTTRKVSDTERRVWLVSKNGNNPQGGEALNPEMIAEQQPANATVLSQP